VARVSKCRREKPLCKALNDASQVKRANPIAPCLNRLEVRGLLRLGRRLIVFEGILLVLLGEDPNRLLDSFCTHDLIIHIICKLLREVAEA